MVHQVTDFSWVENLKENWNVEDELMAIKAMKLIFVTTKLLTFTM